MNKNALIGILLGVIVALGIWANKERRQAIEHALQCKVMAVTLEKELYQCKEEALKQQELAQQHAEEAMIQLELARKQMEAAKKD